jgi:lysine 6-dehydrogenase
MAKSQILVLGAGLVGSAMAADLCNNHKVSVADSNIESLADLVQNYDVRTMELDVRDSKSLKKLVKDYDLVIGAVPGYLGYETLKSVIECGKNVVDISFFPEDALELDELAKKKNVTAIVDCGVAPGMGNIILGYHDKHMAIQNFLCYVGGLPIVREMPFQYKAPFSPIDVLEEYTRPARYVENGIILVRQALSDPELIDFPKVGTLEAFNTDGLRSLIKTMHHIPNMKEKTMRYPGHIEYINVLKNAGFLSNEPIDVNGTMIKPIDLSSKILFDKWKLNPGDREFTIMKIIVEGFRDQIPVRITYNLLDYYDEETQISSMSRTTGYTATAAAELILQGKFTRKGICPPEYIGAEAGALDFIFKYLAERNVIYHSYEG